jgi:hypothetical protein
MKPYLGAIIATLVPALALVLTPAWAQYEDSAANADNQAFAGQSSQTFTRPGIPPAQTISGRILRTKDVEVWNTDVLVAQLETSNGRRVIVELGPVDELRENQVRIRKGEPITVRGNFIYIANLPLLIADSLRANGQSTRIDRSWLVAIAALRGQNWAAPVMGGPGPEAGYYAGLGAGPMPYGYGQSQFGTSPYYGQAGAGAAWQGRELREQQVRGRVQSMNGFRLPGLNQRVEIALLRSDQGRRVVAILGPESALEGLELRRGSLTEVNGQGCWVDGTQLILAQEVSSAGETTQTPFENARTERIRGRVTRTNEVRIPGLTETILVAQVRRSGLPPAIVILGPTRSFHGEEPMEGETISVHGEGLRADGRIVLLARELTPASATSGTFGEEEQQQTAEGNLR